MILTTDTDTRITGLRLTWRSQPERNLGREEARIGLVCAMRPFGSLADCINTLDAVADLMLTCCARQSPESAAALIADELPRSVRQ
jgi:hypothetical protein